MKSKMVFLFGLLFFLGMGCSSPASPDAQGPASLPPNRGELTIHWESDAASARALFDSAHSSNLADVYELLLLSTSGVQVQTLQTGTTYTLALEPGTYRVLLLAGVKRSSTSLTTFLVGSAGQDGVVIVDGQRTSVSLLLKAVDCTLAYEGAPHWGKSLTITAAGKTRNPYVGMFLDGTSVERHPRLKSLELWSGGYKDPTTTTGNPTDWAIQATATVPASGSEILAQMIGCRICILGLDSNWQSLESVTHFSWEWLNRADMTDQHALATLGDLRIAIGAPPTGIDLSISWE